MERKCIVIFCMLLQSVPIPSHVSKSSNKGPILMETWIQVKAGRALLPLRVISTQCRVTSSEKYLLGHSHLSWSKQIAMVNVDFLNICNDPPSLPLNMPTDKYIYIYII